MAAPPPPPTNSGPTAPGVPSLGPQPSVIPVPSSSASASSILTSQVPTTTVPPASSRALETSSPPPPVSTVSTAPPPGPPTAGPTPPPSAPSVSSVTPNPPSDGAGITITILPSTTSRVTVVVTNTSSPFEAIPSTSDISSSSSVTPTSTSGAGGQSRGSNGEDSGGLGLAKTVVAIAVPLVSVALIIMGVIIWWRLRRRNAGKVRVADSTGPEYGYAAGASAVGKPMRARSSSDHSDDPYESPSGGDGYRGWGSTGGGRKAAPIPLSSVAKTVSNGGQVGSDTYVTPASPVSPTNPANAVYPGSPTIFGSASPPGTNHSTVGAMAGPSALANNGGGLNRGISNASSNYSVATDSDRSEQVHNRDSQYGGTDGNYYEFAAGGNPYASNPPPVIQDVQARRHTRIETPTDLHYPQQGNSGIAQNF